MPGSAGWRAACASGHAWLPAAADQEADQDTKFSGLLHNDLLLHDMIMMKWVCAPRPPPPLSSPPTGKAHVPRQVFLPSTPVDSLCCGPKFEIFAVQSASLKSSSIWGMSRNSCDASIDEHM